MTIITCPECGLQVSDKAYACPHCGYPMVKQDKPVAQTKPSKHKRLPNGFGQITEIKNKNLRNRFRAMITTGKTDEGRPICKLLKPKSYFATYNEAYSALVEYNKNPYDLDSVITMQELYDKWSKEYYKEISVSRARSYKAAWNYCSSIADMNVVDVKSRHIKACIDEGVIIKEKTEIKASPGTKNTMKNLLNMMFDYAIEYELVDKNYSRITKLSKEVVKEMEDSVKHHIAFDEEELKVLWANVDKYNYVSYIVYQCYSGWRPSELCSLLVEDVHLDEGYIVGGMKTEYGRNRIVPIHSKVRSIVEEAYTAAKKKNSIYLFTRLDDDGVNTSRLSYVKYNRVFSGVMEVLKLNTDHKPHDPRKTFVTMAKKYKMDDFALKRIVGHNIDDITEAIYTERPLEWFKEEMQKIK